MGNKGIKAFTLAEVLITLGIIGVVAAMVIPVLYNNYLNEQYITGLKKAYAEWNQAIALLENDYGCPGDMVCTGLYASGTTHQSVGDVVIKYFKPAKTCGVETLDPTTAAIRGCWPVQINPNYDGSGTGVYPNGWGGYKFISLSGMSFYIDNEGDSSAGGYTDCTYPFNTGGEKVCSVVYIDTNGIKGPNYYGKDVFHFWLKKDGTLLPYGGYNGWKTHCESTGDKNGRYCAARIMQDNWQMNY